MHCGRRYYGLTAAGYRIPFKPLMTLMQLFQRRCGQHKSPRRPATAAPPLSPRHRYGRGRCARRALAVTGGCSSAGRLRSAAGVWRPSHDGRASVPAPWHITAVGFC